MKARLLGSLLVLGVALGGSIAAPAAAAPVTRIVNTVRSVDCVFETAEGDFVFFNASGSSLSGGAGSLMFVETPNFDLVLDGSGGTAEFGASTFRADVPLVAAATGQSVGTGTVVAGRTVIGEPVTEQIRERSGNSWTTGTVVTTVYQLDVTSVTVPGYHVLPDQDGSCTSEDLAFDVKTTNPAAQIHQDTDFESAICTVQGLPFGEVLLTGELRQPHFEVVIDDEVTPLKASGDLQLKGWSGAATAPLVDLATEQRVADLTINVDLTKAGRREHESSTIDGITERTSTVPYRAEVTVTTTDGRTGRADCMARYVTTTLIIRPGAGG